MFEQFWQPKPCRVRLQILNWKTSAREHTARLFWSHFWPIFWHFWDPKSIKNRIEFRRRFRERFLEPPRAFGSHFVLIFAQFLRQKSIKNRIEFRRQFRERFFEPPGTLQGQKVWFCLGKTNVFEDRPLRARVPPSSILEPKMEPKWSPKSIKKPIKIEVGFWKRTFARPGASKLDLGAQNGPKMEPKIYQKTYKNRGRILEAEKGARIAKVVAVCRRGGAGGGVRGGKPPQIR